MMQRKVRNQGAGIGAAAIVIAAGASITSTPAYGIAEALNTICQEGPPSEIFCQWYRGGVGPVISALLPPAQQKLTGTRSIVGMIDALLPLSSHEVFDDGAGGSRVSLEIVASGTLGEGSASNTNHVSARTRATGVLHTAIGNGTPALPQPLARGVAFGSKAYVASVAAQAGTQNSFAISTNAFLGSMLIMADPVTGSAFGVTQPADVIVMPFSFVGDYEGEGTIARIADGIAWMFGTTLVAPTGDSGGGNFPPNQPEQAFRTVGSPASAYNVIKVGGFMITVAPPPQFLNGDERGSRGNSTPDPRGTGGVNTKYDRPWNNPAAFVGTGKGRLDVRNWRQRDPNFPAGYRVEPNVRMGVDIVAPAASLRLATAASEADYSRGVQFVAEDPFLGSNSTSFAAGFVAGGVALLQDAFRALKAAAPNNFPQWRDWVEGTNGQVRASLPNVVVKAILLNSATKSRLWTNQGNQGGNNTIPQLRTSQPLDTTEGAGILDLRNMFVQFQGRPQDGELAEIPATMDVRLTDPRFATRRDTGSLTIIAPNNDPPISNNPDPPLVGPSPGVPNNPPSTGVLPPPDVRNPNRTGNPNRPPPPNERLVNGAMFVRGIGWDYGRLSSGYLDYAIIDPIATTQDNLYFTLCWNRAEVIRWPAPGSLANGIRLPDDESRLQFENHNLQVYLHDGSGSPRVLVADSTSVWDNVEHVYMRNPLPYGSGALPLIRVLWVDGRYDVFRDNPRADMPFGLAWRLEQRVQANVTPGTPIIQRPGDLNYDGRVDALDLNMVLQSYGSSTDLSGDVNHDGRVDFKDLMIILSNFGQ